MGRTREFRVGGLTVQLIEGDIARISSDALVTAINSKGGWFGGIDGVIQRVAGPMFHSQVRRRSALKDGQIIVAKKQGPHGGRFGDVLFVVDDLKTQLSALLVAALVAADREGYAHVSLPAIRTGVMLGMVEKDLGEVAQEIVAGFEAFVTGYPTHLHRVTLVVFQSPDVFDALAREFDIPRA